MRRNALELTSGHQRAVLPLTKFVGAALYSSDHTLWQLSSQSLESSTSWTAAHPFHWRQQKHNSETENCFRCQCECVQQYTRVKKKKERLRRSELNRKSDKPGPLLSTSLATATVKNSSSGGPENKYPNILFNLRALIENKIFNALVITK